MPMCLQIKHLVNKHSLTTFKSSTPSFASCNNETNFVVNKPKLFSWRLGVWSAIILLKLCMCNGFWEAPVKTRLSVTSGNPSMAAPINCSKLLVSFQVCEALLYIYFFICFIFSLNNFDVTANAIYCNCLNATPILTTFKIKIL